MRFHLRTLFAVIAFCCIVFALATYLGWQTLTLVPGALVGMILAMGIARIRGMVASEALIALAGGAIGGAMGLVAVGDFIPLAPPAGAFFGSWIAAASWLGLEANLAPKFDRWASASRARLIRSARLHLLVGLGAIGIAACWGLVVVAIDYFFIDPMNAVDPNFEMWAAVLKGTIGVGCAVGLLYAAGAAIQFARARGREPTVQ